MFKIFFGCTLFKSGLKLKMWKCVTPKKITVDLTLTQLDDAGNNDHHESGNLGVGKNVLDSGSPLHISSIDEG